MLKTQESIASGENHAERVWLDTLTKVRRTKRRRRVRRVGFCALAAALATLGGGLMLLPRQDTVVEGFPAAIPEEKAPVPVPALAVLVLHDGGSTLRVLDPDLLGSVELSLSLAPIMLDASHFDHAEITSTWPPPLSTTPW
jgi:hypothetical protein